MTATATTLLEYVCEQLMGPPTRRGRDGESYWPCPECQHRSFHTLPHDDQYKDRYRCFRCGFRGDVFDILLHFHPGERFGDRKARLSEFEAEYDLAKAEESRADNPSPSHDTGHPFPFRGPGRVSRSKARAVASAWADLTEAERDTLVAAHAVMRGKAVSFEALSAYCVAFVECMEASDRQFIEDYMGRPDLDEEERKAVERARDRLRGSVDPAPVRRNRKGAQRR